MHIPYLDPRILSRGKNLEMRLQLVFCLNLHSNHLQMKECYPHSKEGPFIYSNQLTNLETINLWFFWGSFAIWGSGATTTHLPHGFTPTNTCPTRNSNGWCLGYVAFDCHENFQINWESFAHRDQQKTCSWYVVPMLWRWQMSSNHSCTSSIVKQLRAHCHIWIDPKITNYVESKLSTG